MFEIFKDSRGNTDVMDFGKVTATDGMMSVAYFTSAMVEYAGADVSIPTGDTATLALSDTAFSLGATTVSYALALAVVLFGVQLFQSARKVGRSNDINVRNYIDQMPTGLSVIVIGSLTVWVASLLAGELSIAQDLVNFVTQTYWRDLITTAVLTVAYVGISREN